MFALVLLLDYVFGTLIGAKVERLWVALLMCVAVGALSTAVVGLGAVAMGRDSADVVLTVLGTVPIHIAVMAAFMGWNRRRTARLAADSTRSP